VNNITVDKSLLFNCFLLGISLSTILSGHTPPFYTWTREWKFTSRYKWLRFFFVRCNYLPLNSNAILSSSLLLFTQNKKVRTKRLTGCLYKPK